MPLTVKQIVDEVKRVKADTLWVLSTVKGEIFCENIDEDGVSIIVDGEPVDLSENEVHAITGYPKRELWESRKKRNERGY